MSWVATDSGWKEEPGVGFSLGFSVPDESRDCEYCGEPEGEGDDVLAEWVTGEKTDSKEFFTKMAHGQCGEDAGWRLA